MRDQTGLMDEVAWNPLMQAPADQKPRETARSHGAGAGSRLAAPDDAPGELGTRSSRDWPG